MQTCTAATDIVNRILFNIKCKVAISLALKQLITHKRYYPYSNIYIHTYRRIQQLQSLLIEYYSILNVK